jgi:hypothetical protein
MCGRIRAVGPIRTISVFALLAVAATLAVAAPASATPLEYTFTGSNQGWQQAQDPAAGPFDPAGFQPSGGNPRGRLTARDTGAETGCPDSTPCQLLTFYSPFVSTLSSNYGGTASFDLRSSVPPAFAAELLLLPPGNGEYLDGLIQENIGTGYQHLSIRLDETARWFVCPYSGGSCSSPSQSQFIGLIGASDEFAVMADVGPNRTDETYDLDNVTLTNGGPPAPPPPPPPPPKKPNKCKKGHGHKAAAAAKKCKKGKKKKRRSVPALRG